VEVRGDGDDHVVAGEGFVLGQAAPRGQQLPGEVVEHLHTWWLIGQASPLHGVGQLWRRVARSGQLVPPPAHQVLHFVVALAVAGGPRSDRARPIGSVGAYCRFDLRRAVGVYFPRLFGYPGDGPTAQAPRRSGVGLDAIAELHCFGRPRHAPYGGGGVEMVTQLPGVQALPAAPLVAHGHDIGHQDMVVDLGVAGSRRRMARHRPGEASGGGALLGAASTAAAVHHDLVQVGHGGVPFGVDDQVHVLGPADHPELGHRLMRAHHKFKARAQTGDQALAAQRVVRPAGAEDRSPLVQVHFSVQAQPRRPGPAPRHRCLAPGGVVIESAGHGVVAPPGHGVLMVAHGVEPHHPHPRHRPPPPLSNRAATGKAFWQPEVANVFSWLCGLPG
jgi:hypothetical protein